MSTKINIVIVRVEDKISAITRQIENAGFTSSTSRKLTIELNTWKSALELMKCDS